MQFYFCLGLVKCLITIFRSITLFCGTNSNPRNIFHIQIECEEYSIEYCQSHITLLWIWIMLCFTVTPLQRFELKHIENCKFMWSFDNTLLLWIWSCIPRENSTHKCSIQKNQSFCITNYILHILHMLSLWYVMKSLCTFNIPTELQPRATVVNMISNYEKWINFQSWKLLQYWLWKHTNTSIAT